jgi:hypothetical protein
MERANIVDRSPQFASAFGRGDVTAGHVDAFGRTLRALEPAQQQALLAQAGELVDVAATANVEDFAKHVRRAATAVQADDGMERLERQRRANRLRWWIDREGMWNLTGRFDPLTGSRLDKRLDAIVAALFAERTPPDCPSGPVDKQQYLRALALAALIEGDAARGGGRTEMLAVMDADEREPNGDPVVDWGLPVEIPARVLADLFNTTDTNVVIVRNGVVLYAPGTLNLGRSTRVANRAQRRALRGLYSTCAIPGCAVHYDRCKLHHLIWWENGGLTDLDNLFPLCVHHHHKIHDAGWKLARGPNRELMLTLPDGAIHITGPRRRRAA